jgi:hypothetical protein
MKKKFFSILVIISNICIAQTPRIDTLIGGTSHVDWHPTHLSYVRTPVLMNPAQALTIDQPNSKICFNKKAFVKTNIGGREVEMNLFFNSDKGFIGHQIQYLTTNTSDTRFNLTVITKKGNFYNYHNTKKNGDLKHYVSTGNTESHTANFDFEGEPELFKKPVRESFCNNKFKAQQYKSNGASTAFFLYGQTFPSSIKVVNFLGYYGVGFAKTNSGVYISLAMDNGSRNVEIRELEIVETCFELSEFTQAEAEAFQTMDEELEKKKTKLEAKTFSGDCVTLKNELKQKQLEQIEYQKQQKEIAQSGNVYQNKNVQDAYAKMQDPKKAVQIAIVEMDLKICQLQSKQTRSSNYDEKMNCYTTKKASLQGLIGQFEAIDTRLRNNLPQAFVEKQRLYQTTMLSNLCR